MKDSAGILPFKIKSEKIKVLLGHMGGPIYENVDECGWSILKGEIEQGEKPLKGAIREFQEETTEEINENDLFLIGEAMQRGIKRIIIYGIEKDFDYSNWYSNNCEIEWPKNSGQFHIIPEMDYYEWMDIEIAKKRAIPGQSDIFETLENIIEERYSHGKIF